MDTEGVATIMRIRHRHHGVDPALARRNRILQNVGLVVAALVTLVLVYLAMTK